MKQVVPPTSLCRAFVAVFLFAVAISAPLFGQDTQHRGRKYTPPPPTAKITVTVTKAANGKPVENAAVVFHPMKNGKDQGGLELKSNEEGKVSIDVIPIGTTVRLQIIAKGFQTFGEDYDITGDSKDIAVKLNPPDKQYSIYEQHDTSKEQGGAESSSDHPSQPNQKPSDSSSKPPQSN
ncbi:MAG TPA: carboxypeptidase-like regulatory domain-containing protein [Silvibacterium sp.]|nr:carboxypeptidase-like regulatory domain-containing protein [Silvibacterium sp.]